MLRPVEYNVTVKLKMLEKKTAGGIILPDQRHERDQMAITEAELIDVGGNAFQDWKEPIPQVGDRILVRKYAGEAPFGDLEDPLRVMTDKEIVGIIDG